MAVEKYEITTYPERRYIIFRDLRGKYLLSFLKSQEIRLTSDITSRRKYDFLAVKIMDVKIEDDSKSKKRIEICDSEGGYFFCKVPSGEKQKCAFSFKKEVFERFVMHDLAGAKLMYELGE